MKARIALVDPVGNARCGKDYRKKACESIAIVTRPTEASDKRLALVSCRFRSHSFVDSLAMPLKTSAATMVQFAAKRRIMVKTYKGLFMGKSS